MSNFMSNFEVFLNFFLNGIGSIYTWFMSTIIGQILIFTIIISIFIYIIYKLTEIGN